MIFMNIAHYIDIKLLFNYIERKEVALNFILVLLEMSRGILSPHEAHEVGG